MAEDPSNIERFLKDYKETIRKQTSELEELKLKNVGTQRIVRQAGGFFSDLLYQFSEHLESHVNDTSRRSCFFCHLKAVSYRSSPTYRRELLIDALKEIVENIQKAETKRANKKAKL